MSDELPKGWATATLGGLFDFKYGKGLLRENRNEKGSFKVYGSNGVVGVRDKAVTKGPTIIVGRKGSVGEVHFSPEPCWPIDTAYFIDEFPFESQPVYWALYFKSLRLGQQEKSSAIPGISRADIYGNDVPIPPLGEQRRIVAKLEKLLGQVDACQQRLEKLPTLLKRFRQSILAAACSGRLTADWRKERTTDCTDDTDKKTSVKSAKSVVDSLGRENAGNADDLPEGWRNVELRDICSSISDGDHLPPPQQPNGIAFLTIGNISSGFLDFSQTRFVSESYFAKIKAGRIPKRGDTLYTVVGASIGVPVMVETDQPFCFQRHIAILKPSKETDPKFLHLLMGSPTVFREGWARITGSAQPTLPLGNLRSIPISVPPLAEQQEIVRRVAGLFALADQLEQRLAQARKEVDKLTPSLLARAFAGQLVPQNPADEPAEKLLEKIHARSESKSRQDVRK